MTSPSPAELPATKRWFRIAWGLWIVIMVGFSFPPIYNFFKPNHETLNKDYDIWYDAGRAICEGTPLYVLDPNHEFPYLYPPTAAVVLAPLTVFGKLPFIVILEVLNSLSWIGSVWLALILVRRMGSLPDERREGMAAPLLAVIPVALCVPYVWDTYHLGQPNILLLACMLGAAWCLLERREFSAGALVAFAASIKAFPILAGCYLIYRRQWRAVAGLVMGLAVCLLILPGAIRGWDRNVEEIKTWGRGMVTNDPQGIGQRADVTYRWKNQSLIATCHRLLRQVPADVIRPPGATSREDEIIVYANVVDLDFSLVNKVAAALGAVWGLAFVALIPWQRDRTPRSDVIEFAMLLIMITCCSPISWFYYGVWLLLPFLIVVREIAAAPRGSRMAWIAGIWLLAAFLLLDFVPPWQWYRPVRAVGTPLFGYLLLFGELAWLLRHSHQVDVSNTPTSKSYAA
jgi:hypothetical protein